jgi:hypothetical protein
MDHTIKVMSSAIAAKEPPMIEIQNQGERRGRGGCP